MNSEYGSEWRKWDFHVHTPYSILNNQFGMNANDPCAVDEYVKQLFTKAIEKEVWAIGITDYFSIDGYAKIRGEYLNCPDKLEELFPDLETRDRIGRILVFPNIEMRLNCFVEDKPVGYHVMFSDAVAPEDIESKFLRKLTFSPKPGESWSLSKEDLSSLGKMLKRDNDNKGDDYEVGLGHVTVAIEDVRDVLTKFSGFDGKYLISAPVDEAASGIDWGGRDYLTRKNIYASCHCYMTSSTKTRKWALGEEKDGEDHSGDRIAEFGSIKPCIWGSDAHSFDRMFEPAGHRYCWVKADPTFDGLLQILCEPKDRIVICEERPEPCDPHRSIDSIQFDDERFPAEPVRFSEGLTCVIGGRSTGKSLLLRQLASSIDPEQVREREARSSLKPLEMPVTAKVTWRDGTSDPRRIIYLPQTFLNRTVDDPQSDGGASGLIREVLLQNEDMRAASEEFERKCAEIEQRLQLDIADYLSTRVNLDRAEQRLREHGSSKLFEESVKGLEAEYKELLGPDNASQEDIEAYSGLMKRKGELEEAFNAANKDVGVLRSLPVPRIDEPSYNGAPCYDVLSDEGAEGFRKELESINESLAAQWSAAIERVVKARERAAGKLLAEKADVDGNLAELKPKMEHSGQLAHTMARLNEERKSLIAAEKIEDEVCGLRERLAAKRAAILESREAFKSANDAYCSKATALAGGLSASLEFSASPVWRRDDFSRDVVTMLNAHKFSGFRSASGFDLNDLSEDDYDSDLIEKIWDAILAGEGVGSLQLKGGASEEDFLRKAFGNWYIVHYVVTSEGDRLDQMSPGKKGLVLLELIMELERGDCPILIDQPEDDLDNQSIYTELRKFIKDSKRRRQIIIVTHNANIALGADAEEIIVANQDGVGRENANGKQFDYRSGAIESTSRPDATAEAAFLDSRSIQEHVCEILEGGREALEQRRRKYSIGLAHGRD